MDFPAIVCAPTGGFAAWYGLSRYREKPINQLACYLSPNLKSIVLLSLRVIL